MEKCKIPLEQMKEDCHLLSAKLTKRRLRSQAINLRNLERGSRARGCHGTKREQRGRGQPKLDKKMKNMILIVKKKIKKGRSYIKQQRIIKC